MMLGMIKNIHAAENSVANNEIWIRLPKAGCDCPHSGLKRGALFNLATRHRDRIKMAHLREPGTKRGNRLIWLPSLLAYLHEAAEDESCGGVH